MTITRREFAGIAVALLSRARVGAAEAARRRIDLILAPSNLGLRQLKAGVEPGTWRAPEVLLKAGLEHALGARRVMTMERPLYEIEAQPATRVRNGQSIRTFSMQLGEHVRTSLASGGFPVVIGGDCSVLLGALYGARLAGARGLVHVDGHSDFSHPGNYDASRVLGAAAGMDLALVSGRGEKLLTEWPQVGAPLAADADIVQIGERNASDPSFMRYYGDILDTEITQLSVQSALAEGVATAARRIVGRLKARGLTQAWLHVDLDVLDESVMPAVDSPGAPGFNFAQLSRIVSIVCASGRIVGADFAIYDPDLDLRGQYARPLVECIAGGLREGLSAADA